MKRGELIVGIIIVAVLGGGIFLLAGSAKKAPVQQTTPVVPAKPPTPEVVAYLAKSNGFQYLVTYSDKGFEPRSLTVHKGETVRFVNDSSGQLWVAASGTTQMPVYPGESDCGSSSLDTCRVLQPQEFWEFTLSETGTWTFQNNLDKGKTGAITVRAL